MQGLAQFVIAAALVLGGFSACGPPDECTDGEVRCENNVAMVCQPPCSDFGCRWSWQSTNCTETNQLCVQTNIDGDPPRAFCAISPTPEARCVRSVIEQTSFCDGDRWVLCNSEGYPVQASDCHARGQVCAEGAPGEALCALSRDPDPQCMAGALDYCSGNVVMQCDGWFSSPLQTCNDGCVATADNRATCTRFATPPSQ